MAVALRRSESGTQGLRRIVRRQIANALEVLDDKQLADEAIHSARKELKKARATLRLLRKALGDAVYKRENAAIRDAARPLSDVRDSRVLLDTLDGIVHRYNAPACALRLADHLGDHLQLCKPPAQASQRFVVEPGGADITPSGASSALPCLKPRGSERAISFQADAA